MRSLSTWLSRFDFDTYRGRDAKRGTALRRLVARSRIAYRAAKWIRGRCGHAMAAIRAAIPRRR